MPITRGAKKAVRVSERKRVFNDRRRRAMKDVLKSIRKAAEAKNAPEAKKLLSEAYKAIDKAAKRGVIKKNNAARKKSRLVALVKKIQ
ncbi:MAG: 30S ribosomal protein S20 [Parcubacteria group bacterium]|nr:30S ribosomal protein S20 [Parcubacteria group bacterium]